jgi:hypothetical protein
MRGGEKKSHHCQNKVGDVVRRGIEPLLPG